MISMQVANTINSIAQAYITYHFICKIWKPRYNYMISNIITCFQVILIYIKTISVVMQTPGIHRVVVGLLQMIFYAVIILDGTIAQNIVRGTIQFSMFAILELIVIGIFQKWLSFDVNGPTLLSTQVVFARIIYTLVAYWFITVLEFFIHYKKSKRLRWTAILSIVLAMCDLFFFCILILVVWENGTEYLVTISGFYAILVLIGYHITSEAFYEIIRQQEKKNELKQKMMERQYQYDYYMLAKEQAEQARDLRHDMRNQLQTVQCLMQNEDKKERQRAREMLEKLSDRVEGLLEK